MINLKELTEIIGDKYYGKECHVNGVSFNSNDIKYGNAFVAIVGQRDGHNYINHAIKNGAVAIIVSKKQEGLDLPQIVCSDTKFFLYRLAQEWRLKFNIPIIAITGSCGKTSTKDIIGGILKLCGETVVTYKNYNNDLGVPFTILQINSNTKYAVLEIGTNSPGEIKYLSELSRPTHSIITNISGQHLEKLKTIGGVLHEKFEIFKILTHSGIACINYDETKLVNLSKSLNCKKYFYSTNSQLNNYIYLQKRISSERFIININGIEQLFKTNLLGEHNLENIVASISCLTSLNIPIKTIKKGIMDVNVTSGRFTKHKLPNNIMLINDTYNASLNSVKAAIAELNKYEYKTIFVMTDMAEMGDATIDSHIEMGKILGNSQVDKIYFYGDIKVLKYSMDMMTNKDVCYYPSKDNILDELVKTNIIKPNSLLLIKGSRSNSMEYLVDRVLKHYL